jgi:hypothetical protein
MISGWLGNKLYGKLDEISNNLTKMAAELHTRVTDIDKRLVVVETHCGHHHRRDEDK